MKRTTYPTPAAGAGKRNPAFERPEWLFGSFFHTLTVEGKENEGGEYPKRSLIINHKELDKENPSCYLVEIEVGIHTPTEVDELDKLYDDLTQPMVPLTKENGDYVAKTIPFMARPKIIVDMTEFGQSPAIVLNTTTLIREVLRDLRYISSWFLATPWYQTMSVSKTAKMNNGLLVPFIELRCKDADTELGMAQIVNANEIKKAVWMGNKDFFGEIYSPDNHQDIMVVENY